MPDNGRDLAKRLVDQQTERRQPSEELQHYESAYKRDVDQIRVGIPTRPNFFLSEVERSATYCLQKIYCPCKKALVRPNYAPAVFLI